MPSTVLSSHSTTHTELNEITNLYLIYCEPRFSEVYCTTCEHILSSWKWMLNICLVARIGVLRLAIFLRNLSMQAAYLTAVDVLSFIGFQLFSLNG